MALEYKVTKEDHGKLDEVVQGLYKADGDDFRLDVTGTDDAKEIKEALRKEREARRTGQQKIDDLEKANGQAEQDRLKEKGEFKELWENAEKAKVTTAKELSELKDKIANGARTESALAVALGLTKDTGRAELLKKEALQFISHTEEGGVKLSNPDGTAWTAEQLGEHLTKTYPFLVDGSQSSGGGANGDGGGGTAKTIQRADFDAKNPTEKAALMKDGTKVVD